MEAIQDSLSYVREELKSVTQKLFECAENGQNKESFAVCLLLSQKERLECKEEQLERERKEKEEQLERERKEKEEQLERERKELERERKEKEEQLEREHKEKEEQLERERKVKEWMELLEKERKRKEEEIKERGENLRALFGQGKDEDDPIVRFMMEEKKELERRVSELLDAQLGTGSADAAKMLETMVEGFSNLQQLITAEKTPRPKGFSQVGSEEAEWMLTELEFDEENGNQLFPIEVPPDAPQCAEFDYAEYPSENAGTQHLLQHHRDQLSKFGVRFGRGAFGVYDLHKQKAFSLLTSTGQSYRGSVDGAIAPFGLGDMGVARQLRICYEHKQTERQKAEYRRRHPDKFQGCMQQEEDMLDASTTMSLQLAGGNKGQAVTELLAAYSVNSFPLLLDLTDGKVHHLLCLTGPALVFWENLTPTQAYYKQAQLLTSSCQASSRHLRLDDIPEEESIPLKKMRKWRPQNGLLAQLSCLEDLPVDTRVETALDLFRSWNHITPPLLPMPQAVAHFYA